MCGDWDKAGRWYPDEQFIIPGSFKVRSPSRAWPHSFIDHFKTVKYAKLLAKHKPELYMKLVGIKQKSKEWEEVMSWAVAKRLKGEG